MAFTKEQDMAINTFGNNIIVSAGAGSGKTAVLSERVITHLKKGTKITSLLILTFTKAAAEEMKDRIRKKIMNFQDDEKMLENLNLIDEAYITTFDSYALSIVKKYHYLLNISKDIKITDSSIIDAIKSRIMDEVFLNFYKEKDELFLNFIKDFCTKDDKVMVSYLLSLADKISIMPDTIEYLDNYFDTFYTEEYMQKVLDDYFNILQEKIEKINIMAGKFQSIDENNSLEEAIIPLINSKTLDEIIKNSNVKLPVLRNLSEEEKEVKEKLSALIKDLRDTVSLYGSSNDIINNINNTKTYLKEIIKILKTYFKALEEEMSTNNIYDFNTIAKLAIKVLKENEEALEEVKSNLTEIMIDEYQDTSDLQEEFIRLIANKNVYMVGDIKQSIYRFRNANPKIFKDKYDLYSKNISGIKIDLVKNFRSREEVLDNINEIFNIVMSNKWGGADYKESHKMVFGNNTYMDEGKTSNDYNMKILEYTPGNDFSKEEIEAFIVAEDIKNKLNNGYQIFDKDKKILRDAKYSDFVILMDRSSSFLLYKKIFEYLNIPLELYLDQDLNNNDNIYIIKNIIDFIIRISNNDFNEEFKYDYVSIARSYLFNLSDQEIYDTVINNKIKESEIYNLLSPLSLKLNSMSISSLIEEIIDITNLNQKLINVGNTLENVININKILELATNYNELGLDIISFNEFLKTIIEKGLDIKISYKSRETNAVKIMNIHKSKGLEFHICYYTGLYKEFNINDLKEQILIDSKYGIVVPIFNNGLKETVLKFLVKNNYLQEEISEKIRLFYVALTRCKEEMILVVPKLKDKSLEAEKIRSFLDILNLIKKNILKYYKTININSLNLSKDYIKNELSSDLDSLDSKEFKVEEITILRKETEELHYSKSINKLLDEKSKKNIEFGLKFHENLEYLNFANPNFLNMDSFMIKKIKAFLDLPLVKNNINSKIYHEYEFRYTKENTSYHGIIDLMLENDDEVIIIDYKLKNIEDEAYKKQLNGYKKYVECVSNKKVSVYLYSIIDELLLKVDSL